MSMKLKVQNLGRALRYFVTHGRLCRHEDMGAWWPCNYGADEVRTCSACDRIEKRRANEGGEHYVANYSG